MKQLKRILCMMLVLSQLFLLSGCGLLKEMRRNHCFWDGNKILRNGSVYMALPKCEDLCPDGNFGQLVYVTKDDVPVLLSAFFAEEELVPSTDDVFLISMYRDTVYCREDKYDEILTRIRDGFTPEVVCYTYEVFNEDSYELEEKTYTLTKDQVNAIELITSTVEPQVMGEGWSLNYEWCVGLEERSGDDLFRRCNLEIAFTGKSYYVVLYTDTQTMAFAVPEGCHGVLEEITKAYLDSWDTIFGEEPDFI